MFPYSLCFFDQASLFGLVCCAALICLAQTDDVCNTAAENIGPVCVCVCV